MQEDGPVNYYREASAPLTNMTANGSTEMRLPLINFDFVASERGQNGAITAIVVVVCILLLAVVVGGVATFLLYRVYKSRTSVGLPEERRAGPRSGHGYDTTVQVGRRPTRITSITSEASHLKPAVVQVGRSPARITSTTSEAASKYIRLDTIAW